MSSRACRGRFVAGARGATSNRALFVDSHQMRCGWWARRMEAEAFPEGAVPLAASESRAQVPDAKASERQARAGIPSDVPSRVTVRSCPRRELRKRRLSTRAMRLVGRRNDRRVRYANVRAAMLLAAWAHV